MNTSSLLAGLLVGLLFLSPAASQAQWQPDVRLTNDPASSSTSLNNASSTATSGNDVHVVWSDGRHGFDEIYYKSSPDGGTNWAADTRLTDYTLDSRYPSVSVSGSTLHVVWQDFRDTTSEIYHKRSTDGGMNWGTDTRLTNNSANKEFPSVSVSGSAVHVLWHDRRDGNDEIYYKRSTDGGLSWGTDTRLTNEPAISRNPSVSVSGSVAHVVWFDERDGGNREIYYKRSTDAGASWGADTRLTNEPNLSYYPCVSVSGQVVNVVWMEFRNGNWEIYYKRSTDAGASWGTDTRLTNNTSPSWNPSVSVSGSVVHVVWYDERDGNNEIYYKRSTDGGSNWSADTRLTNNTSPSWNPSVAVSVSAVHVVWMDARNGNWEIYCKRDPAGNPTGVDITNVETPVEFKLHQNFPNPFNPTTTIRYGLPASSHVVIKLYSVIGEEVATLVNETQEAGFKSVVVDANKLASGVYFYTLVTNNFVQTKRLMLLK